MSFHNPKRRLLIIDDNPSIHDDFRKILHAVRNGDELSGEEEFLFGESTASNELASFDITSAFQGQEGLAKVLESLADDQPFAMAFVDIRMPPGWDGVKTIGHLWEADPRLQVVICTAHSDYSSRDIVERLGETDRLMIIKKPFDQEEVRLAATALCEKWSLARKAEWKEADLQRRVAEQTTEIAETRDLTVFALARLAESRDPETGEHLHRMRAYSQVLAEHLSESGPYAERIDAQFLDDLYRSSPLHDIGKVGIPDAILLKRGPLSEEEFETMKQHTLLGAETLADAARRGSAGGFLTMAVEVAQSHHERFDGTGYPDGLSGDAIPLSARIVAVADVFDALTSKRVYKDAMEPGTAYDIIVKESGQHFDPVVVQAFVARYDKFVSIARQRASDESPKIVAQQQPQLDSVPACA